MISSAGIEVEFVIHGEWNGDGKDGVGPLSFWVVETERQGKNIWSERSWNFIFSTVGCYNIEPQK